jgi:hypothetical protein
MSQQSATRHFGSRSDGERQGDALACQRTSSLRRLFESTLRLGGRRFADQSVELFFMAALHLILRLERDVRADLLVNDLAHGRQDGTFDLGCCVPEP